MEDKKYLFLIPRMGSGGAERVMATIANQLCKNNDIIFITITGPGSFYKLDEKIQVICVGKPVNRKNKITYFVSAFSSAIKALRGIAAAVERYKPEAMLSFMNETNIMAIVLKILGIIKCRLIVAERADPTQRATVFKWIEKKIYPVSDIIVCQSYQVAQFFSSNAKDKIRVIKNPICKEAIPEYCEKKTNRIVGVGRLDYQKNFSMLIDAFNKLDERFTDYSLDIYGDGKLKEELNSQIKRLNLSSRVHLMGVKNNVMHYIQDAALFVLSSNFEGFPNALIEAMATGIPVITTDFSPKGVANEIVKPNNGIIVPTGDSNSLSKAIMGLLADPQRCKSMGENNRKILAELGEERIASEWEMILQGRL